MAVTDAIGPDGECSAARGGAGGVSERRGWTVFGESAGRAGGWACEAVETSARCGTGVEGVAMGGAVLSVGVAAALRCAVTGCIGIAVSDDGATIVGATLAGADGAAGCAVLEGADGGTEVGVGDGVGVISARGTGGSCSAAGSPTAMGGRGGVNTGNCWGAGTS